MSYGYLLILWKQTPPVVNTFYWSRPSTIFLILSKQVPLLLCRYESLSFVKKILCRWRQTKSLFIDRWSQDVLWYSLCTFVHVLLSGTQLLIRLRQFNKTTYTYASSLDEVSRTRVITKVKVTNHHKSGSNIQGLCCSGHCCIIGWQWAYNVPHAVQYSCFHICS